MTDIAGRWIHDFHFRGRVLRVFFKPWAWPYCRPWLNLWILGAGPVGAMFWPAGDAGEGSASA